MSFDYHDFDWVNALSPINFYAVFDVVLDVRDAIQLQDDVAIPILPTVVKFSILMPGDAINTRDRYCELRWDAAKLLQKKGIIQKLDHATASHRWQGRMKIVANKEQLEKLAKAMAIQHGERVKHNQSQEHAASPQLIEDWLSTTLDIVRKFHAVAIQLKKRHQERPTLIINDEYDVQDLLHAVLLIRFNDVRAEEWTPSYAGKSSRMDFLIKEHQLVIETKMARHGLSEKELGDQLIIDIERYRKHQDCKHLICMIYDPESLISNPEGLRKDLSGSREGLIVEVVVVPSRM